MPTPISVAYELTRIILNEDDVLARGLRHPPQSMVHKANLLELMLLLGHRAAVMALDEEDLPMVEAGAAAYLAEYVDTYGRIPLGPDDMPA